MKKIQIIAALILLISATSVISKTSGLFPTRVKVTVLEVSGEIVNGATVQFYKTKDDYLTNQNLQFEGVTNKKGWIVIKKIEAIPYFIEVTKGEKKNYGKGVQIEKIYEGKKNKINIIIE
ncbi:MAG: carboxypeptidase regulatory-like domain-containing protein [Reichenbachiella sp.]|uniref:carboxypeptidase regulatory-like domain-containing protein n=1 Tax=Reichenbachiella sp. TaxID=2184521 RepID=UPI00326667AC